MAEHRDNRERAAGIAGRLTAVVALGFAGVMAALLLVSAYGLLTHLKLQVNDYGTYTNFLWNSAHGRPFLCFVDQNYLRTHLSFTLLLVAPLFRAWDDPFLLMVVQWLCPIVGALIVWRVTRRLQFAAPLPAVFVMLYFAYPYTQSVLSCDFHGVCLYLFLLPWLYYCLALRKEMAWLPWLLILGLREDAAFAMLPLLLYFAVADRWKTGYVLAGLALAYSLLAMMWLFPQINEITLAERRASELSVNSMAGSWELDDIQRRAEAILWLVLPALPLLRRQWVPILVFPSIALLVLQLSHEPRVHGLGVHYPAAVYPLVALAIVQAWALEKKAGRATDGRRALRLGLALVAMTLGAHFLAGRFPRERRQNVRQLWLNPNPSGQNAMWATSRIPREGVLLTDRALAGLCANRADLLVGLRRRPAATASFDLLFVDTAGKDGPAALREYLSRGMFGVTYFDHRYVIAQRGFTPSGNRNVITALDNLARTVVFAATKQPAGETIFAPGCDTARYWSGDGARTNAELTAGGRVTLPPGHYEAVFRFRAEAPRRIVQGSWGRLSVWRADAPAPLVTAEIDPIAGATGEFRYQTARFSLPEESAVEPRVRGADAPLWLDRVMFVPAEESAP